MEQNRALYLLHEATMIQRVIGGYLGRVILLGWANENRASQVTRPIKGQFIEI